MATSALARWWPALAAAALYLGLVALLYARIVELTRGEFTYPIDDTYIHLAIGKNLGQHGVWGNTEYGFASASSSLLWTILLAIGHAALRSMELLPLLLNVVISLALVVVAFTVFRRYIE